MIPFDDHQLDLLPSDHHKQQQFHDLKICCDEKAHAFVHDINLFADLDVNTNPQTSFSIRNYVFGSRSKNIACNWPFSHKTLQTCLQHEVKNILPPIQSLESLRNNSSDEEIISSCNENSRLIPELTLESRKSKISPTHIQQGLGQTKSKKPVLGFSRKTETESAMSSKICPVCKVFSSSSNTTLNAHIDQCLSGESTMKWSANLIKHRIKPRKMRLMVDIYKTVPHCTVEELDARNGTVWANNSSFSDQEVEFQGKQETEEPAANTIVDHEGDVYSNNNRTKVTILSVPKVDNNSSNDDGIRKKQKNKNHELKHDKKYLKQSPNSKKSSPEVTAGRDKNADNGECHNKEAVDKDDLQIVRPPWACSKRTGLAKRNLSVAANQSFSKSGFEPPSSLSNKTRILSQQNSRKTETLTPKKANFAKKRSLLSTKPSSKPLKKHDTIMQNGCEDPSDSCRVKRSDVRSKGSKLSLSRDNLVSVIGITTSKINLKRKFSSLKRLQDSLKQKSGVKEDTFGKISYESMNVLEVKKNENVEICRPENSASSKSLNEGSSWLKACIMDPSCDIDSVRNEKRSNKEQASSMQVPRSSDNMINSRECTIDVNDDIERQHYHDMSESPVSTISNPSLTRSKSDKFYVRSTSQNDEKDDQSTLLTKHDVESFNVRPHMLFVNKFPTSSSRPPLLPPPMKLTPYRESDSASSPLKPVIRLMGKNLTVVNTDEDKVNCVQFPNDYQDGFKSQQSTVHPPNSLKNHALDTMFQNTTNPNNLVALI